MILRKATELAYGVKNETDSFRVFTSNLNSTTADGSLQLRRPEWTVGANWNKKLLDAWHQEQMPVI